MSDDSYMRRALALAARGLGLVEPNPPVGCVIVKDGQIVGEGWHQRFGGPHAEIEALQAAGEQAHGATLYVTLEPCCHTGKTPPCTDAIMKAGITRVVAATCDPYPQVNSGGFQALAKHGIACQIGVAGELAEALLAPYLKRVTTGQPWVIAKWAMSLDGKIATTTGQSKWITSEASRQIVHELRGKMDAILIGSRTAELDDPLLTARPPGPRVPTRIVFDSQATLSTNSQLVRTAHEIPVFLATSETASASRCEELASQGVEILRLAGDTHAKRLQKLLVNLGERGMTNLLVEGGGTLLGALFDLGAIDEVHAFLAPTLIGGAAAPTPLAGTGISQMPFARQLQAPLIEILQSEIHISGRLH